MFLTPTSLKLHVKPVPVKQKLQNSYLHSFFRHFFDKCKTMRLILNYWRQLTNELALVRFLEFTSKATLIMLLHVYSLFLLRLARLHHLWLSKFDSALLINGIKVKNGGKRKLVAWSNLSVFGLLEDHLHSLCWALEECLFAVDKRPQNRISDC